MHSAIKTKFYGKKCDRREPLAINKTVDRKSWNSKQFITIIFFYEKIGIKINSEVVLLISIIKKIIQFNLAVQLNIPSY